MSVKHLLSEEFDKYLNDNKYVLVDCFATWCGPCQMLSPVIDQIVKEQTKVSIAKIDIDECPDIAEKLGIEVVPTLLLFKNAKLVKIHKGLITKEALLSFIGA